MPNTLPENLKPLELEIGAYFRELPRLIEDGNEGKYALIQNNRLVEVFATLEEADLVGHDMFGLDNFMAQKIRAKDLVDLAPFFSASEARIVA